VKTDSPTPNINIQPIRRPEKEQHAGQDDFLEVG